MNKLLRILGLLIGLLIVLVVLAALVLPHIIDPNNYRDEIAEFVHKKTGRQLQIAGEIGWSFFPWLGVEVGETQLSNAAGFGEQPFARVETVEVRVKLMPLLRKELEMSTLVLKGLQLNLAKDKQGRTNWDDLLAAEDKAAAPAPKSEPQTAKDLPLAALSVGGIQVLNAQLVWEDRAAGTTQRIENLNLTVGAIQLDEPVDIMLNFIAKTGSPEIVSQVKMSGRVDWSESFKHVAIPNMEFSINAEGASLPNGKMTASMRSQLALDREDQTLSLKEVLIKIQDVTIFGSAQATAILGDTPQVTGNLKIKDFDPRAVMASMDVHAPEVSDAAVLSDAGAEFAFKANKNALSLNDLKAHLDDTKLTGSAGLSNFAAPAITFKLNVDTIDLDRYLPPQKPEQVKAPPTPAQAAAGGTGSLPLETLRELNLNGTLKIGRLKAYQLRSHDITVTLAAKDGLVRVHPASAKMYEGSYNGNVTLDARGKELRIALDEKLNGVQIGPLLTDMQGDTKITGRTDLAVQLTAQGNDPMAVRKAMNGNARFAFTDGTIKGMNVLNEVRKAYAVFKGKPAPASEPNQTDFSSLTGTATITNGLLRNEDLLAKSAVMQVQGNGSLDLVAEKIDYRATATLVDALEGKGELTGKPIPLRITGTFSEPKVGVDIGDALKAKAKEEIEKQIEKKLGAPVEEKKRELEDDVKKKVEDKLKGLFGR